MYCKSAIIIVITIFLLSGLIMRLECAKLSVSKDHFTQTVDFSKKLTDHIPPSPDVMSDGEQSTTPVNNYITPTIVYTDDHQFDHVYLDHISKKTTIDSKSERAIDIRADVRIDGYINAKTIQLSGAPLVSYNNSTNTIEFQ